MSDDAKMWQDAHARAVAEIARLRSVCRECINTMTRCQERECRCNSIANPCPRCRFRQTIEYAEYQMGKSDAGKEPQ